MLTSRQCIFFLALIIGTSSFAQSPADWWYFGENAGIHFTENGPVAVTDGNIGARFGCSTISDELGNLLFYTNGEVVYDRTHTPMPNGQDLEAHRTFGRNGAQIVKHPGNSSQYYIFTADGGIVFDRGFQYTLVDMNLRGGLGDVVDTEKNVPLLPSCPGQQTLICKPDGYWVVTKSTLGNTYSAFEVTAAGINLTPVESNIGIIRTGEAESGVMKASPSGEKIAAIVSASPSEPAEVRVDLLDFDIATGQLSNSRVIDLSMTIPYGLEFSPNEELLYVNSSGLDLHQYDITHATGAEISASIVELFVHVDSDDRGGQMQLGPDGRIYVSTDGARIGNADSMGIIHNPDVYGFGCNFERNAFYLGGGSNWVGLPFFCGRDLGLLPPFNFVNTCVGDTTEFSFDTTGVSAVSWDFDDPESGSANTSTEFAPGHVFSDTGLYTVRLVRQEGSDSDTTFKFVRIDPVVEFMLPADTLLCSGDTIEFGATQAFAADYIWHNGSTQDSITVTEDTLVSLTVTGVCNAVSDTIRISYDDSIKLDLGPDTLLCGLDSFEVVSGINQTAAIQWNTGDSTVNIMVDETGEYEIIAMNACGLVTDTVLITFRDFIVPFALSGPETLECVVSPIAFDVGSEDYVEYLWSTGDSVSMIEVDSTQTQVWLEKSNECNTLSDTVHLVYNGVAVYLGEDTTLCDRDALTLNAFSPGVTYIWNNGDTSSSVVAQTINASYSVTVTNGECTAEDEIVVNFSDLLCEQIVCMMNIQNVFTPNGDGINDMWHPESDCKMESYSLVIYNRWGVKVHTSDHNGYGWNGMVNGKLAPEGTYYFELILEDNEALEYFDQQEYRGSITLLHN